MQSSRLLDRYACSPSSSQIAIEIQPNQRSTPAIPDWPVTTPEIREHDAHECSVLQTHTPCSVRSVALQANMLRDSGRSSHTIEQCGVVAASKSAALLYSSLGQGGDAYVRCRCRGWSVYSGGNIQSPGRYAGLGVALRVLGALTPVLLFVCCQGRRSRLLFGSATHPRSFRKEPSETIPSDQTRQRVRDTCGYLEIPTLARRANRLVGCADPFGTPSCIVLGGFRILA